MARVSFDLTTADRSLVQSWPALCQATLRCQRERGRVVLRDRGTNFSSVSPQGASLPSDLENEVASKKDHEKNDREITKNNVKKKENRTWKTAKEEARNYEKESEEGHDNKQRKPKNNGNKKIIRQTKRYGTWESWRKLYLILNFRHPVGPEKWGKM